MEKKDRVLCGDLAPSDANSISWNSLQRYERGLKQEETKTYNDE